VSPVRAITNDMRVTLPGLFIQMDPPEHTRYRRALAVQFTVARMRVMLARIAEIVSDHLDAMDKAGSSADLVAAFARPIPLLVICELLGVPARPRAEFVRNSDIVGNRGSSPEALRAAVEGNRAAMREVIRSKRDEPDAGLISGLVHEEEAPDQVDLLRADPTRWAGAVEELLRYLTVVQYGVVRIAAEVELAGDHIMPGDPVVLSLAAANRDPAQYDHPDTLDVIRPSVPHIAFGYGVHQCIGQHLARAKMQTAYRALFDRFPAIRLDVARHDVRLRSDMNLYGVHELPVRWTD
jgi:cytochrome P450